MGGKSSGAIIGYRYYLGMHMVFCHKADALLGITVGDRILYGEDASGTRVSPNGLTTSQDFQVNKDGLFGGDQREGGVSGAIRLAMGEPTQQKDPYLEQFFGQYTPAFRGVVSLILKGVYIGINPYLKNWAAILTRTSYDWQPTLSKITSQDGHADCNPAHIIRECIIDEEFGMGYSPGLIDETSFGYAAQVLFNESFGLSLIWDQQSPVENLIQTTLTHINGVLSVSQTTGKFVLKLLRADYTVSSLPVFDESNIKKVDSYQRASWGETVNEVTVQHTDRYTARNVALTVQDLANMQIQGAVVSHTNKYKGIIDSNLASRVAQRDLQTLSTPLSKIKLSVNRKAWNRIPGDVFVFSWEKLGIASMVFRVGQLGRGTTKDGTITVEAIEDVFALPAVAYGLANDIELVVPPMYPVPAPNQRLLEATFLDLVARIGANQALQQHATAAFVIAAAARPEITMTSFIFEPSGASSTGPFDTMSTGYFSPSVITPALVLEDVSTFTYTGETDLNVLSVGDYGYIDDEIVSVAAINTETKSITINRGVLDTVPTTHNLSRLYVTSKLQGSSIWEYASGDLIYGYIRPNAPLGTLDRAETTALTKALVGRPNKPYAPGRLQLNGSRFPASLAKSANLDISWAHRDRVNQVAYIVLQTESNIGPEAGTTYSVLVTNSTAGVVVNQTGITGNTYTALSSVLSACPIGSTNTVEVWSTRSGVDSYQKATAIYQLT